MRLRAFASRNTKELLRDPASLVFSVGLPIFLLILISVIQRSIGVDLFRIERFAPGVALFSLAFVTMFSSMLIAGDRASAFLSRLYASPLTPFEYILGYALPLLPLAMAQVALCYIASLFLGLHFGVNLLWATLALLPAAVLLIALGLLLGSVVSPKQAGPVCSILVQVVALSSGTWFDLDMIGGVLRDICYALPFAHALDASRAAIAGQYADMLRPMLLCAAWAVPVCALAAWVFRRQMKG